MNYSPIELPLETKQFPAMNRKEAKTYFDWFIIEIPNRLLELQKLIRASNFDIKLDYTKESLTKLWTYFLNNVKFIKKREDVIELERKNLSYFNVEPFKKELSMIWFGIVIDIGIYFAECFRKQHNSIYWSYVTKPKDLISVNRPVLRGFKYNIELDPIHIIYIQVLKILIGEREITALEKLFIIWKVDVYRDKNR